MEGLLIAEELVKLPDLPAKRLPWRFSDAHTFVLPLDRGALWLWGRAPQPRLAYRPDVPPPGGANTGFQDLLVARAVGELLEATQHKLDRVVYLRFGAAEGFVPVPGVMLVAELTGRNGNLLLLDEAGVILGAARDVPETQNRYRQVRAGLPYTPPPPYDKLDPRRATDGELRALLGGHRLSKLRSLLDGVGPDLSRALAATTGLSPEQALGEAELERLLPALRRLAASPGALLQEALELPDPEVLQHQEAQHKQAARLRTGLAKARALLENRLSDIGKARAAAAEAQGLRQQADLLMAYAQQVPKNAKAVTLTDFSGQPLTVALEPKLSALQNAQAIYGRARKREAKLLQAEAREAELRLELAELNELNAKLGTLDEAYLARLLERFSPEVKTQARAGPGIRYQGPFGYEILVGRSARDNDVVTFKLARSRDLWLHVQGYTGSHVVVRAENKEVPFEVVLFAAQLAAAYSKAGQSDNVPVDYTLRKNVWKPKGAAPGAVHYTQQKTVFVTPERSPLSGRAPKA